MTDEEKKAIENCNDLVKELKQNKDKDFIGRIYYKNVPIEQNMEILLNLIQKQQVENEELKEKVKVFDKAVKGKIGVLEMEEHYDYIDNRKTISVLKELLESEE